jgi:creatinine amidohydrolase/Fe(II)-dependent formamide hydrolase-like protein
MRAIVVNLLQGFERSGFDTVILLAGHAPNIIPPTNFLSQAVEAYHAAGGSMRVLPFIVWMGGVPIDHAGTMETSAMLHYYPETVDMTAIAGPAPAGLPEPADNWMADIYQQHPCYGICRPDPRGTASAAYGEEQSAVVVEFLADWLNKKPGAIERLRQYRNFVPIYE